MIERDGLIAMMAKHLPPSGATLRLLDVGAAAGDALAALRPDLDVQTAAPDPMGWQVDEASVDAIAIFEQLLSSALLAACLRALRPGGRLIIIDRTAEANEAQVERLAGAGYTRILVEALSDDLADGALLRGEKAHTTADTLARVRVAAQHDDLLTDLNRYPGRYLHLLIHQMPNKPVWALRPDEALEWRAVAVTLDDRIVLLAFSSLAKAVAFMQPAVLAGHIRDINKVGKFSAETARAWTLPMLLNPDHGLLADRAQTLVPVDPSTAEQPDE
ncbi:MAG: hypothetical protein IT320_10275 [Anaerolineae bacterium]|nr:hypothetical protein [Anaerolineae bacterium]